MPIVYRSNRGSSRPALLEFLEKRCAENPDYRVLDIGGAADTWADHLVSGYIDIQPVEGRKVFVGDVNRQELWDEVARESWDFCICSHLLEDIRCPDLVVDNMRRIFKGGYIATPNKHTEFANVESRYFVGYCHHRWIYTLDGNTLRAVAKMPVTNYFSRRHFITQTLTRSSVVRKAMRFFLRGAFNTLRPAVGPVSWWERSLASPRHELAFIWEDDFEFVFLNDDFAGQNIGELASLYTRGLKGGL